MTDEKDDEQRRIEREIRSRRKADLASALAGRDGGGHLRGASPTPVIKRALLELEHWLEAELRDHEGALREVILRRLAAHPDRLEGNLGDPAATVRAWLDEHLGRSSAMEDLVREADVEWGRRYGERPHFDRRGEEPHPDDPYTLAGVTERLEELRRRCGGR